MKRELLHTPEGVRDIYNDECERKLYLEKKLFQVSESYGYHPIETPSFEFFDIFGKEVGTIQSKDLYKFFDREGNTLVLRPDITPSIARSAAKYYMDDDMPLRFCYKGNTFINHHSLRGRLKETTQFGAELMGDNTVDADAEVLAMIVECLQATGLKEFQISVGHAGIFHGLIQAAGFDEEDEETLRSYLSNKNYFGVEEFISSKNLPDHLSRCFEMLSGMYPSVEAFDEFMELAKDFPEIDDALKHLKKLQKLLLVYGIDHYISFEPGMISDYQYYTGILLAGYTFGSGEMIVKGGRYDKLLQHFGKNAPAIGFAFVVDQLLSAITRQKIELPIEHVTQLIVYKKNSQEDALITAKKIRATGGKVELMRFDDTKTKADYENYAKANHIARITFMDGE